MQHHLPAGDPDLVTRDRNGYCELRSYAVIGDGRTMAFIAGDGRVD